MKAKTKIQKQIIQYSESLPKIGKDFKKWALSNHKNWIVFGHKYQHFCLECGHQWKADTKETGKKLTCQCPKCKNTLHIPYRSTNHVTDDMYFSSLETSNGYQVVRIFFSQKHMQKRNKPNHEFQEIAQHWIDEKGKVKTISAPRPSMVPAYDLDRWKTGKLEFRSPNHERDQGLFRLNPHKIYQKKSVLPIIKRNGFKGGTNGFEPQKLFQALLANNKFETLYKTNQYWLANDMISYLSKVEKHWDSVKIAIRRGYIVKNVSDWVDYLDLLDFFGKDLKNPFYVCPTDLEKEHNRYVAKKKEFDKKEGLKKLISTIKQDDKIYREQKKRFFDLLIKEGNIEIRPLKSVREFFEYGSDLDHCLFANEYHKKQWSLILAAKVNGKVVETAEVELKGFSIVQSRGLNNKSTEHHTKIISLLKENKKAIAERAYKKSA